MAGLRAGHARPLQGGVNELRAKARPTEYGKVGCRAACPQAATDVCGNEKPCGLCCRGRRPRRPAEGSRPLPTMQRIKGVVMAGLRAGHARPLQGGVNELRAKARPTEYGKVGCRAACPQAATDVCGNEKPCGLCCRGRRPRRPAEGSRPLPTMQRIKGVVMAGLRAGHARPLQGGVNGSRTRGAREGGSPAPFRVRRLPGNGRPRTARRNPPVR